MDKIWYRNPTKSEVIGRCGGDEKTERPHRTDTSRTLKNEGISIEFERKNNKILVLLLSNMAQVLRIIYD